MQGRKYCTCTAFYNMSMQAFIIGHLHVAVVMRVLFHELEVLFHDQFVNETHACNAEWWDQE